MQRCKDQCFVNVEIFLEFFVLFDYLLDLQVAMKHRRRCAMDFGLCLVFCGCWNDLGRDMLKCF